MHLQTNRTNRWVIIILFFLQFLLVGGFIVFTILTNETVQQQNTPFINTYNGISNVELSPTGLKVFQSLNKMYLIPIYQQAAAKYNIPWEYLAAINYVESTLWTNKNPSSVGAIGPMQFMELTWVGWDFRYAYPDAQTANTRVGDINDKYQDLIKKPEVIKRFNGYGVDGDGDGVADPFNEVDAIFAAANYLAKHGMAEGNIQSAIKAYNNSMEYVEKVKRLAREFTQPVANRSNYSSGVNSGGWGWPLQRTSGVRMTSPFSWGYCTEYFGSRRCGHGGVDYAGPNITGDIIVATQDGMAYSRYEPDGCGYYVYILHGNGVETYYCHMVEPSHIPTTGKFVRKGDPIGKVGSTGRSTGPHLHYMVKVNGKRVNPIPDFIHVPSSVEVGPVKIVG